MSDGCYIVVLAYLKTLETKKKSDMRFQWKLRVYKLLYERGYVKKDILELTRFIDWIMVLPKELEQRFDEAMVQFEEERKMRYVTSHERIGMEKGLQQGLLQTSRKDLIEVLRVRFEIIPRSILASIDAMTDVYALKDLLKKAVTIASVDEFDELLQKEALTESG